MTYKEILQEMMDNRKGRVTYPTTELFTAHIDKNHLSSVMIPYQSFMDKFQWHIEKAASTKNPGIVFNIENLSEDYVFFIKRFLDIKQLDYVCDEERMTIGWI